MPSETTILIIMLAGVVGGAVGAGKQVPAWHGIVVALAFIFGGGTAVMLLAPTLQGTTAYIFAFIISLICVVVVGGLLKMDSRTATRIVLGSILFTIASVAATDAIMAPPV